MIIEINADHLIPSHVIPRGYDITPFCVSSKRGEEDRLYASIHSEEESKEYLSITILLIFYDFSYSSPLVPVKTQAE